MARSDFNALRVVTSSANTTAANTDNDTNPSCSQG